MKKETDRRMKANQMIYDAKGNIVLDGNWDPKLILKILGRPKNGSWHGKSVLDIGANTGGLSLELARCGAIVTMLEPDPLERSLSTSESIINKFIETEELNITIVREQLFHAHRLERFDIILFLGLVYHFKYPQYCLDYISSLGADELFISTQTMKGEDLCMTNRLARIIPRKHIPSKVMIAGYHPTHKLFRLMLKASGYHNVKLLNDKEYEYPTKQFKCITNSAYYYAQLSKSVDPELEKLIFL